MFFLCSSCIVNSIHDVVLVLVGLLLGARQLEVENYRKHGLDIDCHVLPDPLSLYPSVNPVVSQWAPITRILSSLEVNMTWASVLVDC